MKKLNKGFTLIELLVVIAIIGILSSVVLASLNTARDKGSDAAAKANINNARSQAELYYDSHGSTYDEGTLDDDTDVCSESDGIASLVTAADEAVSGSASCAVALDGTSWAAEVDLNSNNEFTDDYYCVDSTGNADIFDGSTINDGTTPDTVCGA